MFICSRCRSRLRFLLLRSTGTICEQSMNWYASYNVMFLKDMTCFVWKFKVIVRYGSNVNNDLIHSNWIIDVVVDQWPGSYCDTKQSCCYPTTGKPASDFGIHGLWPNYNDGTYPSNCDSSNPYVQSKVTKLPLTLNFSNQNLGVCFRF